MPRGTTLIKMLDMFRAEARLSLNPAHQAQVRDTHVHLLQRVQETLWTEFDWPHLRVSRDVLVQSGQRYYDLPEDIDIDRIEKFEVFRDDAWFPLCANIESCHYATYNSDLDERAYPPTRWQITENEMAEIWPVPDQDGDPATMDGTLRFTGIRKLKPLVADIDRADLDDNLIVLYAAAEKLASDGSKDAKLKLDKANAMFARMRGSLIPRRRFNLFGINNTPVPQRMRIGHYKSIWGND